MDITNIRAIPVNILVEVPSPLSDVLETLVINFAVLGAINRAVEFIAACEAKGATFN